MRNLLLATAAALALAVSPANAAYITIDDSDPDTFTLTAGGFNGFLVNNAIVPVFTLASGLTFNDGQDQTYSATLLNQVVFFPINSFLRFAPATAPDEIMSYIGFVYESSFTTEGAIATISGTFGGSGVSPYFIDTLSVLPQDGGTYVANLPGIDITFITEAADTPEPASLAILGLAAAALAATRRRPRRTA
jgi:hypothetical protein